MFLLTIITLLLVAQGESIGKPHVIGNVAPTQQLSTWTRRCVDN